MNLDFTREQDSLRAMLRQLLGDHASLPRLRELWSTETGRDPLLWERLAEAGVPALMVPELHGGLGADELDVFVVLEEVGRSGLPDAVLESCYVVPVVIAASGSEALRERWLPRLATGEARATVTAPGSMLAPDANISDLAIIRAGDDLVLLERADFTWSAASAMNPSDRLFHITSRPGAGTRLAASAVGLEETYRLAGSSALLVGLSSRLLELTVDYAKVRSQFGRAIGSFQAVKHQLAHAYSLTALARNASIAAAQKLATRSGDAGDAAALAHVCALETAKECNRVSLQIHGGIGFSWEHDLQILLKVGKSLELMHGTHRDISRAVGAAAITSPSVRAV